MSPELQTATLGLVIGTLLSLGAIVRYLPELIKKRVESAIQERQAQADRERMELQAEIDQNRTMWQTVQQLGENIGAIVSHLGVMVREKDAMRAEVHGMAVALTNNTESLGTVTDALDRLFMDGSVPLSNLTKTVEAGFDTVGKKQDAMQKDITDLSAKIDAIPTAPVTVKPSENGHPKPPENPIPIG